MTLPEKVTIPQDVLSRNVDGEELILSLDCGEYFGLDGAGALMWEKLREGQAISAVVDAIVAEYDTTAAQAEADVAQLLTELQKKKLVSFS